MADTPIKAVEAAIYALVSGLAARPPFLGPFVHVGRWFGPVLPTAHGGLNVDREISGRTPALLLSPDHESGDEDVDTLQGDVESRGRSRWVVWVILRDPRGAALNATGALGEPGVYDLIDATIAVLCNAPLQGGTPPVNLLLRNVRLAYRGYRFLAQAGGESSDHTIVGLFFEAERSVPTVFTMDASVPLSEFSASEHLIESVSAGADPIVSFTVPTT